MPRKEPAFPPISVREFELSSDILHTSQIHRVGRMDISTIDSMLAQLKSTAGLAAGKPLSAETSITSERAGESLTEGNGVDFASVFKKSLDQVNSAQQHSAKLARDFELGAPEANLTEAMIAMQKASISFQYSVQVRNKLVSAYQDIMNMPV
jgi:flagellar hook-basal body complex protein FliE